MYIPVRGYKNEMKSCHFSIINNTKSLYIPKTKIRNFSCPSGTSILREEYKLNKEFLFWFSGFTNFFNYK